MATHSRRILYWRIPWREEPGMLQSMGSQRVRCNLATKQQQQELTEHNHCYQRKGEPGLLKTCIASITIIPQACVLNSSPEEMYRIEQPFLPIQHDSQAPSTDYGDTLDHHKYQRRRGSLLVLWTRARDAGCQKCIAQSCSRKKHHSSHTIWYSSGQSQGLKSWFFCNVFLFIYLFF